jgi:hypothetical protein
MSSLFDPGNFGGGGIRGATSGRKKRRKGFSDLLGPQTQRQAIQQQAAPPGPLQQQMPGQLAPPGERPAGRRAGGTPPARQSLYDSGGRSFSEMPLPVTRMESGAGEEPAGPWTIPTKEDWEAAGSPGLPPGVTKPKDTMDPATYNGRAYFSGIRVRGGWLAPSIEGSGPGYTRAELEDPTRGREIVMELAQATGDANLIAIASNPNGKWRHDNRILAGGGLDWEWWSGDVAGLAVDYRPKTAGPPTEMEHDAQNVADMAEYEKQTSQAYWNWVLSQGLGDIGDLPDWAFDKTRPTRGDLPDDPGDLRIYVGAGEDKIEGTEDDIYQTIDEWLSDEQDPHIKDRQRYRDAYAEIFTGGSNWDLLTEEEQQSIRQNVAASAGYDNWEDYLSARGSLTPGTAGYREREDEGLARWNVRTEAQDRQVRARRASDEALLRNILTGVGGESFSRLMQVGHVEAQKMRVDRTDDEAEMDQQIFDNAMLRIDKETEQLNDAMARGEITRQEFMDNKERKYTDLLDQVEDNYNAKIKAHALEVEAWEREIERIKDEHIEGVDAYEDAYQKAVDAYERAIAAYAIRMDNVYKQIMTAMGIESKSMDDYQDYYDTNMQPIIDQAILDDAEAEDQAPEDIDWEGILSGLLEIGVVIISGLFGGGGNQSQSQGPGLTGGGVRTW